MLQDGKAIINEDEFKAAVGAADPTMAWLIDSDGTVTIEDVDDVTRAATPGAWPRFIGRVFIAKKLRDRYRSSDKAIDEINKALLKSQEQETV